MKQQGREIMGDSVKVENYTNKWLQVRLHPIVFYRRYEAFATGFKKVKGLYAEIDMGQCVVIRFTDKSDVTEFHRMHHEYI